MREPLRRYHSILKGQSRPSFQVSKSIQADIPDDPGLKGMWKAHSKAARARKERPSSQVPSLLELKEAIASRML